MGPASAALATLESLWLHICWLTSRSSFKAVDRASLGASLLLHRVADGGPPDCELRSAVNSRSRSRCAVRGYCNFVLWHVLLLKVAIRTWAEFGQRALWHFNNTQLCTERLRVCRENIPSAAGLSGSDKAEWIRAFVVFPPNFNRSLPECHSRYRDSDLATHCPISGQFWPQFPVLSGQPAAVNVVFCCSSSLAHPRRRYSAYLCCFASFKTIFFWAYVQVSATLGNKTY